MTSLHEPASKPDPLADIDLSGLFDAMLDATVDAIALIDESGTLLRVNSALSRIFQYRESELLGRSVEMLMPSSVAIHHRGYLERYLDTGDANIIGFGREVEGRRRDGSIFPLNLSVGEGWSGGRRFFVGLMHDLSERTRLKFELRYRDEALQRMLDNRLIATATTDYRGRFRHVNSACEVMLGYQRSELLQLSLFDVTGEEEHRRLQRALRDLATGADEILLEEHSSLTVDGRIKPCSLYVAAVHDHGGERPDLVVQIVDRTRQREAEREARSHRQRLAHLQRVSMLGQMAGAIAHELNQPLGAINNYAQSGRNLLAKENVDDAALDELFEKMGNQALRAGDVLRKLRLLASGEEGQRITVDLATLVHEIVVLAELEARDEGLRIRVDLDPAVVSVQCDPIQIQQVLLNLLRNGVESMRETEPNRSESREILVGTRREDDQVVFRVRDEGTGVDPDIADQLTDPFVSSKGAGMGLGLAICQSIVLAHGGRLWYQSNERGPGTTFFFSLPDLAEDEE